MEMYQFIKQIGQSRYGDVWLVKGSKTKGNYVLKRIDFHRASKREQRAAQLEAKLLCTVKHPNIIKYLDSFYNSKGSLFIVMSYCEHGNLHDFIKNGNGAYFEEEEIVNWLVQICMALKYLHDQSILHRDIKTQNIFLTKQKQVKIGDFGIARIFSVNEDMCSTLVSSPCYTSPEVFSGAPFCQKSDVWSLGCCVYEIATLKYAFVAQDISASVHQVIHSKLSTIPEIYSSELFHLILSMLNVLPEKRPSATELLLNDYIRKHILLFLRDSSQRSNSSQSSSYKLKCRTDSGTNSETSSSTYSNETEGSEDVKCKIREGRFKTVPDINGNGDGNDNSQQGALGCKNSWSVKKKSSCLNRSKTISSFQEKPLKTVANNNTEEVNSYSEANNFLVKGHCVSNVKQLEKRLSFYTQKMKSESSFHLLNSLTNSINMSRFNSLDSFNDCNHSFKTKYNYGENPPKSADDLLSLSKRTNSYIPRRPATSGEINFDVMSGGLCGSCLPQINESENEKNAPMYKCSNINLPPLHCGNNSELRKDSLSNLEESIVDKFLLRNIMECNKVTQKDRITPKENSSLQHKLNEALPPPVPNKKEVLCQENGNS